MRSVCKRCTVVAGDVYDNKNMVSWTRAYKRKAGRVKVWAFHNYKDATVKRGTTRLFLRTVRGPVWITETGGIRNRGGLKGQAKAVKRVFTLARSNKRIKRVYFYQWRHVEDRSWDSAFLSAERQEAPGVLRAARGPQEERSVSRSCAAALAPLRSAPSISAAKWPAVYSPASTTRP